MFNTTTTAEKVPISTAVRFNQIQVNFSDTHDSCKKKNLFDVRTKKTL